MTKRLGLAVMLLAGVVLFAVGCCGSDGKQSGDAAFWQAAGSGEVIAEVGGIKIYMEDFVSQLEQKPPYVRARYATDEKKREFLDSLITFEVLSQAAIERGLHKDPKVVQAAKQTMLRILMENEIEKKFTADDIPEADLRAYYDANKDQYNNPERRRAAHILIRVNEGAPEDQWQKARAKAEKVYADAIAQRNDPNSFRRLAKDHSDDDATKNRGGDLSYFSRTEEGGPMVRAFSDAVFAMENTNDIVGPVRTQHGWHIIKLTGKLSRRERTFEQVVPRIKRTLFKDRQQEMFESMVQALKAKTPIQINQALLDGYTVPGAEVPGAPTEAVEQRKPDGLDPEEDI